MQPSNAYILRRRWWLCRHHVDSCGPLVSTSSSISCYSSTNLSYLSMDVESAVPGVLQVSNANSYHQRSSVEIRAGKELVSGSLHFRTLHLSDTFENEERSQEVNSNTVKMHTYYSRPIDKLTINQRSLHFTEWPVAAVAAFVDCHTPTIPHQVPKSPRLKPHQAPRFTSSSLLYLPN